MKIILWRSFVKKDISPGIQKRIKPSDERFFLDIFQVCFPKENYLTDESLNLSSLLKGSHCFALIPEGTRPLSEPDKGNKL